MFALTSSDRVFRRLVPGLILVALAAIAPDSLLARERTVSEQTVICVRVHRGGCCGHACRDRNSCSERCRHQGPCDTGCRHHGSRDMRHQERRLELSGKLDRTVNFDFDRAELNGEAESQLAALAAELTAGQWADAKVSLFGNTDTVGNPGYNEQLSAMRAGNVRNWLTSNIAALKADNISLAANGEANPIEEPRLDDFRSRTNRRVDIRVASYQAGVFETGDGCMCCCLCGHCHRPYWWDRHPSRN